MAYRGDYGQQDEPRRPRQQDPRLRPAATPPQWGHQGPPRQDGTRPVQQRYPQEPQPVQQYRQPVQRYPQGPQPQPAFQPAYPSRAQPPRAQYPPPQPAWQPNPQQQRAAAGPPLPPQYPRKSRKGLAFLGCGGLGALVVLIVVVVSSSSPSSSSPPASSQQQPAAAPAQAPPPASQTVTYVVTGSAADVTYGPAGSSLTGTVPMRLTKPLGTPLYYSVQAQLQGAGSVSCQILVDGTAISSSTATGGYNIAQCEIGQDPLSGQWQDDNG
jgi:hypothetical protein